jgi:hypothetical protein
VYSNRVEIKGAIPPQLLGMNDVRESLPAPVISSGRGTDNPTQIIPFLTDLDLNTNKSGRRFSSQL